MLSNPIVNFAIRHNLCSSAASDTKKRKSLIVDFAHRRASYIGPQAKKSVQFSSVQDIRIYQCDDVDVIEISYSQADCDAMKSARKRAVKDVRKRYSQLVSNGFSKSECFEGDVITGIENCLNRDILAKSVRSRAECLRAVLQEQTRQRAAGEYNPFELAKISQIQSTWAAKRAEKVAYHQSR